MKKKIIILLAFLIIVIALIVVFNKKEETNKIIETSEKTAEVTNQSIVTTLTAPGEVQSAQTEKLTLNTSYKFLTMCAEKEEFIKEGSNLLKYTNGTYITAPYDCVIIDYSIPEVKASPTSSNYIQISSVEDLYMEINIGEDKIDKVSENQEVAIIVNYDETKEYKGTITKINAIGTNNKGTAKFSAIASLKNDGNLKLGMSATCEIVIESAENVVAVPLEAIQTSDEGSYVIVVNEDGTTENVIVETGISNDAYIEIISGISENTNVKVKSQEDSETNSFRGGMPGGMNFEGMPSGGSMPSGGGMPDFSGGGKPNMR